MAIFRFFMMAAVRHLGFWKFQIFNGWDAQDVMQSMVSKQ